MRLPRGTAAGPARVRGRASLLFASLLLSLAAWPVLAHPLGLSLAVVTVEEGETRAEVNIAAEDLEDALGVRFYDRDAGQVPPARLTEVEPALADYLRSSVGLRAAGRTCAPRPSTIHTEGHLVRAELAWGCGRADGELVLGTRLLEGVKSDFVQHVLIQNGPEQFDTLLRDGRSEVALSEAVRPLEVASRYVLSGIEHIFVGLDHIAFMLGLLLWADRLWPVVKVVTAFTVAHTVTLSLAVLDVVQIPASIVEPAIAATVVWVAVENFLNRDVGRRWRLAITLGLVHGFGFAGVLQEYGLPARAIPLALGSFNLGVELGQLGIVMLLMPALWTMDRLLAETGPAVRRPALVHAGSAALAVIGAWWLAERTVL